MEAFDANVLLRLVYRDDPEQADRASRAWRKALETGGIFLTTTVLIELAWVLRVAARFDRRAIASALGDLCNSEGVTIENHDRVRRALARFRTSAADFSDCLVLESARDASALPVITFDERFAREPNVVIAS